MNRYDWTPREGLGFFCLEKGLGRRAGTNLFSPKVLCAVDLYIIVHVMNYMSQFTMQFIVNIYTKNIANSLLYFVQLKF